MLKNIKYLFLPLFLLADPEHGPANARASKIEKKLDKMDDIENKQEKKWNAVLKKGKKPGKGCESPNIKSDKYLTRY